MIPIVAVLALGASTAMYTGGCSAMTGKSTGEFFDDAAITAKEKTAMLRNHIHLDVDTNNGVVTLKGTVNSEAERAQADQIARSVNGIAGVNDQLVVRGQPVQ